LASQFLFVPSLIEILITSDSYIPRWSSALTVLGLLGFTVGMIGVGSLLPGILAGVTCILWGFVMIFRGSKR
jgi:hypothetical protein